VVNSLKFKLMVTYILLIVVSFSVLAYFLFNSSKTIISSYIEESALEKMQEYATYVEMLQNQVYDSATLVYNSDMISQWDRVHSDPDSSEGTKMLANIDLSEYLTQVQNSYTPLANITIYRQQQDLWISGENYIERSGNYKDEPWYVDIREKERYWTPANVDRVELAKGNHNEMVSMTMPLDSYNPAIANTYMKINVSEGYFLEPLERLHLGETGQIYLIDRNGQMLLSKQNEHIEEHQKQFFDYLKPITNGEGRLFLESPSGETEMVVYKRIPKTKWMLVGIVNEKDLYSPLIHFRETVVIVVSILLLVSIIVTLLFSHSISKPLSSLIAAMRHLRRGDFAQAERRMQHEHSNTMEIAFVIEMFKNMISQLREYIAKEYQLRLLKQKAEYKALVMQINPHFLFNTLEMISSLALQNRGKETSRMILTLGQMMRYSLKVSDHYVFLREKLRFIRHYLDIISVRFQNRSEIQLKTIGELDGLLVLKLIMQPIIENAVKFSSQSQEFIRIEIVIERLAEHIAITVSDNGPGFTEEEQFKLSQQVDKQLESGQFEHSDQQIGLKNVLLRCYATYHSDFQYKLDRSEFGGAMVTLLVPIKEMEHHD